MTSNKKDINILIAEDNYLVSEMIKGTLKDMGYRVIGEAGDGREAVELTKSLKPDVILMDIEMPDMDGIQATEKIFEHHPTPVVVLTAYETPELVNKASRAGVGAYLVKPPNAPELDRAITIAMARFDDMIALRQMNTDLKASNEELDAFAHTVAHDLKHPLDLMIGYADVLKREARLPDELGHYLNLIIRTGHKMNNTIEELQLLAGVRKTDIVLKPLSMGRIVAEVEQRLTFLIEDYKAKIIFQEAWPIAVGYAPWVEEVWANYISNGIQYGGQPPRLQLGATERSDGFIRFWVRDNGPGLTPEEQRNLFTPFTHLKQADTNGLGLGLSIVKRIVEKLGGTVGVESEGKPGQGCVFFFTLPSLKAHNQGQIDFSEKTLEFQGYY